MVPNAIRVDDFFEVVIGQDAGRGEAAERGNFRLVQ